MDDELDMDAAGLPDEPIRDWWTFESDPTGLVVFSALGLASLAATAWVFYSALTFKKTR